MTDLPLIDFDDGLRARLGANLEAHDRRTLPLDGRRHAAVALVIVDSDADRDDVEPVQFRTTVTFDDLGGKTRVTLRGVFPSAEERARVIREYGADKGLAQTMARLDDYLAALVTELT